MPCECCRNFVGYYDNLISTILACSTGGDEMDEGVAWVGLGILCVFVWAGGGCCRNCDGFGRVLPRLRNFLCGREGND